MSIFTYWKAAKIANAVEKDITGRLKRPGSELLLMHYKSQFAWGTEVGNHVFDTVARRSKKEQLSSTDDFVLSLLYMLKQARSDDNEGGVGMFESLLLEILPHVTDQISVGILSEVILLVDTTKIEHP